MNSGQAQKTVGAVMVVGGGIAGMQSALDLASAGFYVYLVEASPAIGGTMAQLDKTFPTNDCSMCILSPKLVEVGRHTNIELLTLSEVQSVSGEAGNFEVTVFQSPRYIDMDRCMGCGTCAEKCPKRIVDFYNAGLSKRKAAYLPYPQAVPLKYVIDSKRCIYFQKGGRCKACQKFCPTGAVNFEDKARVRKIRVGAMILCPGFVPYSPLKCDTFFYGRHPNVVTSLEFERILSASGPYQGHLVRPSDQKEPERIAWLQCVGSRDSHHGANGYCSTVCCTYAIKQTLIAKEHSTGALDAAIFYIDIRTQGKDFEKCYVRAREEGIRFVKSKITSLMPGDDTANLMIRYTDAMGRRVEEEFDMVVLSVGLSVRKDTVLLAEKLDIALDPYYFAATSNFRPVETSRPGIYVCGVFQGPKDIPDSVMQASAAACVAGSRLATARGTLAREKPSVSERIVAGEPPRVGVFVCNCGVNIGGIVRVPEVAAYAKTLPYVAYVEENLFTCSQDTQDKIGEVIRDHGLNRIVVAACSPRTHEPLFRETLTQAGLNKYLFEMANIRNQCSWVHRNDPDAATEKAKDLVRMAVAKAVRLEPLEEVKLDVTQAGLVIGGGLAGMAAALGLADQGFPVHLVEKEKALGGHGNKLAKTWKGEDIGAFVAEMVQRVKSHPLISVHLESTVVEAEGFVGNFRSTIKIGKETEVVEHGAVIIAIGAHQLKPNEYHFGRHPNIFASLDLDRAIETDPERFKNVKGAVFIQCVGSREPQRPYCSKVCCTHSIQSALRLKDLNPDMDIYILFRDIRTYGQREEIYREARSKGIAFVRYSLEEKPQMDILGDKLRVTVMDQMLEVPVQIDADIITLASAIVPPADGKPLSRLYKLAMNEEGFFQEAHAKLRPVDFATDGVYMAGLAHGPKPVEESIAQAQAAAARAAALLASKTICMSTVVAYSHPAYCSGCRTCVDICPFGAASLDAKTGKAQINPAQCKGCGLCVASCRSGALNLKGFDQSQTFAMINEALAS
ncbi:MAG: CoB--CoM heterodisulfide reductase iron-sulfur subunit A family protein [Deltaproteobacteria bacterium]|nr:CoB--CoM heterodisulfide reductase iron-sulfur subunit A family protein [Deltaproteobacteria bacterium]MBW2018984.1 CoB--CoM heterodisulfide reductase iron-sulfur subunit A family protein [Deltaproteobacteria bacterium]MBW2073574.1 CoB--CoM heterodisulfide reductase iron-sulfur subunit A family protein [Deltaproteobacteria bacterium]RLB82712.1 MAG: heterodisulfide reductase [Deltaproteobacteria bacterium]